MTNVFLKFYGLFPLLMALAPEFAWLTLLSIPAFLADTMNQSVYVSLSLIGLVGIVGAGVAVGSGVGMMTMQLAAAEQQEQAKAVAHTPVERKITVSKGFAASAEQ